MLDSWLGIPDPAEVTDDITLTAHLVRQVRQYTVTVTVNDPEYGSVDIDTVTAGYGSSITVSGNVLTVGGTAVT